MLPRFLAPGDDARLAVLLHNIDLPAGEAKAVISTEGPLTLVGADTVSAVLRTGPARRAGNDSACDRRRPRRRETFDHRARRIQSPARYGDHGAAVAWSLVDRRERGTGARGRSARLTPALDRFIPGTWRASALFGGPVRYDAAGIAGELASYPWSCLEQTTSRGFPMAVLPDGPMAGDDRAGRLQMSVASVLDRQRFDGGFALWTASGEAEPWLTPYAMDFLLRAKAAGAVVPDQAMADALKFLREAADDESSEPEAKAAQAYRLYVLARAGQGRPGAARVLAEDIEQLPTPLAKAQLGAALMLAHDQPRAEAAFTAALAAPARKWWYQDYGTALRDQLAIVVLLKESGLLPERLTALIAAMPGADLRTGLLSTQEEAWAVAAAAARQGRANVANSDRWAGTALGGVGHDGADRSHHRAQSRGEDHLAVGFGHRCRPRHRRPRGPACASHGNSCARMARRSIWTICGKTPALCCCWRDEPRMGRTIVP